VPAPKAEPVPVPQAEKPVAKVEPTPVPEAEAPAPKAEPAPAPKAEKPVAKAEPAPAAGEIAPAEVKRLREKTGAGMMDCKKALVECGGDFAQAEKKLREKGLADAAKRMDRATREGVVVIAEGPSGVAMAEVNCETDFVARNDVFGAFATEVAKAALAVKGATMGIEKFPADLEEKLKATISQLGENITVRRTSLLEAPAGGRVVSYIHGGGRIGALVAFKLEAAAAGDKPEFLEYAKDVAMQVASMNPVSLDRSSVPETVIEEQRELFRKQGMESGKPAEIVEKMIDGQMTKFFKEITLVDQAFVKDNKQTISQLTDAVGTAIGGKVEIVSYLRYMVREELG
jgi:elongation factor Ts